MHDQHLPPDWHTCRWSVVPTGKDTCELVLQRPRRTDTIAGGLVPKAGRAGEKAVNAATSFGVPRRTVIAICCVVAFCCIGSGIWPIGWPLLFVMLSTRASNSRDVPVRLSFHRSRQSQVVPILTAINARLDAGEPGAEALSQRVLDSSMSWSEADTRDVLDVDRFLGDLGDLPNVPAARPAPAPPARAPVQQCAATIDHAADLLREHGRADDRAILTYTAQHLTTAAPQVAVEFEQAAATIVTAYTEAEALPDPAIAAETLTATVDAAMRHVHYLHDTLVGASTDRLEATRRYAESRWPKPANNPLDLSKRNPE